MKKISNRIFINIIAMTVYIFSLEMIIRIFTEAPFNDISILRIFLSSLIIGVGISYIGHFFNKTLETIWNTIMVLFIGIYSFVEFGLYNFLGFFMGVGNAEQGTKVMDYVSDLIKCLKLPHWTILIPIVIFLIYFIFIDRKVKYKLENKKEVSIPNKIIFEFSIILLLVVLSCIYGITIKDKRFQNDLQVESNHSLWLYPENSNLTVNNYGVIMYGFCDIKSVILGIDGEKASEIEEEENKEISPEPTVVEPDLSRKIDDTAWIELDNNTKNTTKNKLNKYFMNREITPKNEMTGIFKDKNLIIILMESVNEIPIINDDFPTLSKMYNEGISFRNNYSPRNNCSTGNNEFTVLSSLFTINNTCTANTYATNTYFEGAFNIFKNAGYHTTSYHDYTEHYYKRKTIHKGLGSSKYYGVEDLGIKYTTRYGQWPDDKLLFERAQEHYMYEDKFMTYFATVSPHQTYNISSEMGDRYRKEWQKRGYSINLSRYLSKLQVLDEALEELLKELTETNKLDDTVIALFCDHFPYGLSDWEINQYLKKNNAGYTVNRNSSKSHEVDRTPLIIYNSDTPSKQVTDYTTIIDLLPTLLNMFDLEYDPRLYLGTDIFSESHESRAVFADGSWANELGYYHAPNNKMNYVKDASKLESSELVNINKEIKKRQSMSTQAIRSNYFKYLGDGLKKYSTPVTTTTSFVTDVTTSSSTTKIIENSE